MPDKDLQKLANGFATRGALLEFSFSQASTMERSAFAVISLYAAWEEFCRRLVFSSAAARPFARGGRQILRAPGVASVADVEQLLRRLKRTRPQYRLVIHLGSPTVMVNTCQYLALANEQVISPAILSQNSPADELRIMRNFLAHQNPDTAAQVSLGAPGQNLDISKAISWLAQKQAGGRTRFGVWIADLSDIARACAN